MKIIAAIEADFRSDLWGRRSRLNDVLRGETVLRRTLKRVLAAQRIASMHVVVPPEQEGLCREAASGLNVQVETHDAPPLPWREYVASSRKWSLDTWRGGIGGTCVFDEALNPWVAEALAKREGADGVASVHPAAALLDAAMLDRLIEHFEKVRNEVRMAFTQSAPGLTAAIFMPSLLADMAGLGQPLGRIMAYQPAEPQRDLTAQSCFLHTEAAIAHATGRCIADTDVAVARMNAILQSCGQDANIMQVSRWLIEHRHRLEGFIACHAEQSEASQRETLRYAQSDVPGEVEIELTTADPLANSTLRPRGSAVGERGPMDQATFAKLIDELRGRDDVRIVLGGFGDPLLHPKWAEFVARARDAGIFGIAVRTPAVNLDAQAVESLMTARVDVLNVLLDAAGAETYARMHGADHFDRVIAQIECVIERQRELKQPWPLVVCEMLKTRETMGEMERFYDHWVSKTGWAVIAGPSDYAGQRPDHAAMCMSPPNRFACERIFSRVLVLADGRVTVCDQDFRGEHALGTLAQSRLGELWAGQKMNAVRESHLTGRYDGMALCPRCREWHRP